MRGEPSSRSKEITDYLRDVTAGATGAGIGLVLGPPGAMAGAVAGPTVRRVIDHVRSFLTKRRDERIAFVVALAAELANVSPEVLVERLEADAALEELLVRTMRAAQDAAALEKLVALAMSLASGATATGDELLGWEKSFVSAIDRLDSHHLEVLRRFTLSANENNLGDGSPEFDSPVDALNTVQLRLALPDSENVLEPFVAVLAAAGLIGELGEAPLVATERGRERNVTWQLTDFGRACIARLEAVRDLLQP